MIRRVGAVIAVILAAGGGCSSFPGITDGQSIPVVRLRAEPYSFTYNSGLSQPQRIVVRDVDSWRSVWAEIFKTYSPIPPLPQVDFAQEMVVVAALGGRPSGGFSIFIDGANDGGNGATVVRVRAVSPGAQCGVHTAITTPVDIARLPRREGAVSFLDRAEVLDC